MNEPPTHIDLDACRVKLTRAQQADLDGTSPRITALRRPKPHAPSDTAPGHPASDTAPGLSLAERQSSGLSLAERQSPEAGATPCRSQSDSTPTVTGHLSLSERQSPDLSLAE